MTNLMYRGYTAVLGVDLDAGELFGRTLGTRDIITFQGKTVEEARKSFKESIDFYLACCEEEGKEPDRPYSGRFNVRIAPELHRRLVIRAQSCGQSLNEVVSATLAAGLGDASAEAKAHTPTWREAKSALEDRKPKVKQLRAGDLRASAAGSSRHARRHAVDRSHK
jgi:predicted HicB family RNase H-like nuclease